MKGDEGRGVLIALFRVCERRTEAPKVRLVEEGNNGNSGAISSVFVAKHLDEFHFLVTAIVRF